jgi:nucleoside-diphosphate-sugar epimerase
MTLGPKIYVAGHQGMVGSAVVRALQKQGPNNLVVRSDHELDLCNRTVVPAFLKLKSRIKSIWPLPRWEVFMPTALAQPNSSTKT